jgi:hypothetical protein
VPRSFRREFMFVTWASTSSCSASALNSPRLSMTHTQGRETAARSTIALDSDRHRPRGKREVPKPSGQLPIPELPRIRVHHPS